MDGEGLLLDIPPQLMAAPVLQAAALTAAIWLSGFLLLGWLFR